MSRNPVQIVERPGYRPLQTGLFFLHDTKGVPLTFSVMLCDQYGRCPDYYGFLCDAIEAGWDPTKILRTVREAEIDARGKDSWLWFEPYCVGALQLVLEDPQRNFRGEEG